jgi:hypothetical protein
MIYLNVAHRVPRKLSQRSQSTAVAVEAILMLTDERQALHDALQIMLAYWDRRDDHGWTAADVVTIAGIRELVKR